MRCPRCGNENPEDNRFCGMCGTTLLAPAPLPAKPQAVSMPAPPVEVPERPPLREPVRKAPSSVASDETPSISGPSFLGLNDPPPSRTTPARRASISIDPDKAPAASNLHYLLEDEEDHGTGSGVWKFILILIALGLAVGFGYLRWKQQGFAWLNPSTKKPAIAEQAPGSTDGSPTSTATPSAPTSTPPPTQSAPSTTPSITPEPQQAAQATPNPAPANAPQSNSPPAANGPANSGASTDASKPADTGGSAPSDKTASPANTNPAPGKAASDSANANAASDSAEDAPPPPKPKAEPPPKPRPVIPSDPVAEARKYLYGKGASQDCDRGMRLLKPAANSGNAKAMVEMGALYSAGLCTPHDLPTAYRWFALALRKEPDNQSVQTDLTKLWGEMTQPERQLAMKMTQ